MQLHLCHGSHYVLCRAAQNAGVAAGGTESRRTALTGILEHRSASRENVRHRPNALMRENAGLYERSGSLNANSLQATDAVALNLVMHGLEGISDCRAVLEVPR